MRRPPPFPRHISKSTGSRWAPAGAGGRSCETINSYASSIFSLSLPRVFPWLNTAGRFDQPADIPDSILTVLKRELVSIAALCRLIALSHSGDEIGRNLAYRSKDWP
jgi:hypothetical protein